MFKKICGTLVAVAFVFGTMSQFEGTFKSFVSACSSICSCHNGDGWDN